MRKPKNVYLRNRDDAGAYVRVPIDAGIIIGNVQKEELVVEFIGDPGFDEIMDDIMSAIYHICQSTVKQNGGETEVMEEVYKRTVQAFSLVMDKFNPDAKDYRKDIMTEEELMALEERFKD